MGLKGTTKCGPVAQFFTSDYLSIRPSFLSLNISEYFFMLVNHSSYFLFLLSSSSLVNLRLRIIFILLFISYCGSTISMLVCFLVFSGHFSLKFWAFFGFGPKFETKMPKKNFTSSQRVLHLLLLLHVLCLHLSFFAASGVSLKQAMHYCSP